MSHSFDDLQRFRSTRKKKPSTTCARTGTEAYHHMAMAIPSPEPTSAMMTEPWVSEENFSSCREACAATGPWSIVSDRSGLDELPVNASWQQSCLPNSLLPARQNTKTQTNHLRIWPSTSANLALGRFPSDPLTARFQAGRRGSARYLHFWGSGRNQESVYSSIHQSSAS